MQKKKKKSSISITAVHYHHYSPTNITECFITKKKRYKNVILDHKKLQFPLKQSSTCHYLTGNASLRQLRARGVPQVVKHLPKQAQCPGFKPQYSHKKRKKKKDNQRCG
jgi:hypothetical protein